MNDRALAMGVLHIGARSFHRTTRDSRAWLSRHQSEVNENLGAQHVVPELAGRGEPPTL